MDQVKKIITLLVLVTFLKGLVWSFFIPLWHFPDEQAHFAHIGYLAEGGKPPIGRGLDLSEEILISERILQTKRDGWGNNSFTYHPEFNLEYSDNFTGLREEEIKNLPIFLRKNFVKKEAATYPHLFYQTSTLIYKLFYTQDLFVRTFALRVFWLSCLIGIVWLSFLIVKEIFPRKPGLQIIVPFVISFHPMLTFVSSGVTIDNLANFFFSLIIYLSIVSLKRIKFYYLTLLIIAFFLGMMTKNNFLIALIVVFPPFIYVLLRKRSLLLKFIPIFILTFFIFYLFFPEVKSQIDLIIFSGQIPYFDYKVLPAMKNYSLSQHFAWTVRHTIAEVIPWYWGVFRWLSLALPRWVNRVLMRLLAIAVLGLFIKIFITIKKKDFNRQNLLLAFIFYIASVYFLVLFIWDWFFYRGNGYSFGIQGRYYFPVIITHMILLVVGLETFFSAILKLLKFCKFLFFSVILSPDLIGTKDLGTKCCIIDACARFFSRRNVGIRMTKAGDFLLCFWFILLNLIAFFWVAGSYYDLSNLNNFIIQASQYKPWFAKGNYLTAILSIYFLMLILFIFRLWKFFLKNRNEG